MVVNHTLGVAGGAAGVVQRDGVPFVGGQRPGKRSIARGQKFVVGDAAEARDIAREQRVLHINHQQRRTGLAQCQRFGHHTGKFRVDDDDAGFSVVQHEGQRFGVQPGVQRIQHRTCRGNAKVRFHHRRGVGQHHRHCVAGLHTCFLQGACQLAATGEHFGPVAPQRAMHHRQPLWVDLRGALDERQRRQRGVIGLNTRKILVKDAGHGGGGLRKFVRVTAPS